jgi:HSP20 family protein
MDQQKLPEKIKADTEPMPFFSSLQKEIERVFDQFRDPFALSPRDVFAVSQNRMMPPLDISETADAVEITAELPGVKESDLDISISDGILVLKAEKSEQTDERKKDYRLVERRYGSFRRSVPLGFDPDTSKVKASFKDGVLSVNIQKPAEAIAKTKKIEINKS